MDSPFTSECKGVNIKNGNAKQGQEDKKSNDDEALKKSEEKKETKDDHSRDSKRSKLKAKLVQLLFDSDDE